jgi:hypothetical protein
MTNKKLGPPRPEKLTLTETVGRLLTVGVLEVLRRQEEAGRRTRARKGSSTPPAKSSREDAAK